LHTHQTCKKAVKDGIAIIIENESLRQLHLKKSQSWSGTKGHYQIPEQIKPGELVVFDVKREAIMRTEGVVVYQITDPTPDHPEYVLIIGWSNPHTCKPVKQAFVKIMPLEDYQNTSWDKIHSWLDESSGQSHSTANGYLAYAKAIERGSLPLWVNCLKS
jgi:hypothetical protein